MGNKARRKGVVIHRVTLPEEMSEVEYIHGVHYCARCDAMYHEPFASMNLMEADDLGEDDDSQPLAICRNRLACDGNLVQKAAELVDMVRDVLVSGTPFNHRYYASLTEAFDALSDVYGGLEVEKPRCGECFGPLPADEEDGSLCRFCREAQTKTTGE
jgi:hypothetical protein